MENTPDSGASSDVTAQFTVKIQLGNAACADHWDALQILERVAREINDGRLTPNVGEPDLIRWTVRDENGNTVGAIEVTTK